MSPDRPLKATGIGLSGRVEFAADERQKPGPQGSFGAQASERYSKTGQRITSRRGMAGKSWKSEGDRCAPRTICSKSHERSKGDYCVSARRPAWTGLGRRAVSRQEECKLPRSYVPSWWRLGCVSDGEHIGEMSAVVRAVRRRTLVRPSIRCGGLVSAARRSRGM